MSHALPRTFFIVSIQNHSPVDAVGRHWITCAAISCKVNTEEKDKKNRPMETLSARFFGHIYIIQSEKNTRREHFVGMESIEVLRLLFGLHSVSRRWLSPYNNGLRTALLGFDSRQGKRFFITPQCPDRLWCPPSLLQSGYRELYQGRKATGSWSSPLTFI
jgi:hypothetical protein